MREGEGRSGADSFVTPVCDKFSTLLFVKFNFLNGIRAKVTSINFGELSCFQHKSSFLVSEVVRKLHKKCSPLLYEPNAAPSLIEQRVVAIE